MKAHSSFAIRPSKLPVMILTAQQKADWTDRYTNDQWEHAMDVKAFPAIVDAITHGELDRADRLMRDTFSVNAGHDNFPEQARKK